MARLTGGPQRYKARSSPFAQGKNISHHDHIMDSSQLFTPFKAACSIPGRFSFSQVLLVTMYMFLRSCLLYRIGDDRQTLDILRREEKDWKPRVGSDRLSELTSWNHDARAPHMDQIWEKNHSVLIQDHCHLRVSARDLREQLRYVLIKLRQISAEGLNTITEESQHQSPPKTSFASTKTVVLLCFSLSVGIARAFVASSLET